MNGANRIFDVNGTDWDILLQTLRLAFASEGENVKCSYYMINNHGLILLAYKGSGDGTEISLPAALDADAIFPIVKSWLESKPTTEMSGWDADADHDGSNKLGWRAYVGDWGKVGGTRNTIIAIKPAYIWYGK
jgi:hypothetical protein